jgi:tRNA(Ile)-lysidine synthase
MDSADFTGAVRRTVERYGMDLSRPLVLVSGGPDSVALLRVVLNLGGEPAALHVDHGLRGEESREDARFVRELCERLGIACEVRRLDLRGRSNLQEEARRKRYRLAEEIAASLGSSTIATGHNAGDVAETVLMNLARGAGLRGLSGIPPVRGRIARPLIERRREEILAYLAAMDQPYRTDPTNLAPKYVRNRMRLEVMPVLEDLYPNAMANIARSASLLREDLETLEDLVSGVPWRRGGEVVIDLDRLREMPRALRRYAVRRAYSLLLPEAAPLDRDVVEAILALPGGEGTRTLDLPGGVVVAARTSGELALYPSGAPEEGMAEVRPGRFVYGGWVVDVREVSGFDADDAARPEVAYLDWRKGPYRVRMAREGDIIRPLGLGGRKKVLRAMMDRGVPRDLRRRTPVVVDGRGRVAWIFGGELGEEFKVDARTEKAIRLEVQDFRADD